MKLNEIRELLASRGIYLTKALGQNFLHDANQLRKIVAAGELQAGEKVLEIGPGLGPLTELLLASGANVIAIEMDRRLVEFLRERFGGNPQLELIEGDALAYIRENPRDWTDSKLIANLPYSVASPILVELSLMGRRPKRMVTTLQQEVAARIMAREGTPEYGLLTLLLQVNYAPLGCFKIPPECFFPIPEIASACITLERRNPPLLSDGELKDFHRIVKKAFSERRKMMHKLLKQEWPAEKLDCAFAELRISREIRGERVSLELFVQLTRVLTRE